MDRTKIEAAVKVMRGLTPEERGAVEYMVQVETRKRIRKVKAPTEQLPMEAEQVKE